MRKSTYLLLFFLLLFGAVSFSQSQKEKDLISLLSQASSDTGKIGAMNRLADYYYRNQFIRKGDSISHLQLRLADDLNNPQLLIKTYFDNAAPGITEWTSRQDFERVADFIQEGIDYAKKINDYSYTAIGYARLSAVLRKRGRYAEAQIAVTLANAIQQANDSAKAVASIELGNYYLDRQELSAAQTHYNNAYAMAVKNKNPYLKTDIARCLARLRKALGETKASKEYLRDCIQSDKDNKYYEGLVKDYLDLGRFMGDEYYLNEAISVAHKYNIEGYSVKAKEILLATYLKPGNDSALAFLDSQPDLKDFYMRNGIEGYWYEKGTVFLWTNKPDSALPYFLRTESYMMNNFDVKTASNVYLDIGDCYSAKNQTDTAIQYYLKALDYFKQQNEITSVAATLKALSSFYSQTGDFKNAFSYQHSADRIEDSLSEQAKGAEVVSLDRDRLSMEEQEMTRQKKEIENRNLNLQYMFITIMLCVVFIGLLSLGIFRLPARAAKIAGYFFFISLFEFIVLLLDNNILHTITDGNPIILWPIKIVLIGMLVPVQHFLEHGFVEFLKSKRPGKLKNLLSKKKVRSHKGKTDTEELENDTAVL